jgi:hypothetical protein
MNYGWIRNPAGVKFVLQQLPPSYRYMSNTGLRGDDSTDILLYKAWKEVLGDYPNYPGQQIGDCTSFGTGHAIDLLQCVEIAIGKEQQGYKEICTEAIYGLGRELGNMLGGQDGCVGAYVAKAVLDDGTIDRESVGPYSGKRAQSWGDTGVPAEVKTKCSEHKVGAISCVQTWSDLRASLSNGYPLNICSMQGFQLVRNSKGIAETSSDPWPHCMCVLGILYSGTPDECAVIGNSWGTTGPQACKGPLPLEMPPFCFGARRRVVERMLADQDSWSFSAFAGFEGRALPSKWCLTDLSGV